MIIDNNSFINIKDIIMVEKLNSIDFEKGFEVKEEKFTIL